MLQQQRGITVGVRHLLASQSRRESMRPLQCYCCYFYFYCESYWYWYCFILLMLLVVLLVAR